MWPLNELISIIQSTGTRKYISLHLKSTYVHPNTYYQDSNKDNNKILLSLLFLYL